MAEIAFKNWIDQNLTWGEKTSQDLAGKPFLAHSKMKPLKWGILELALKTYSTGLH